MSGALKSTREVGDEAKSELSANEEVVRLVSNECRTASDIVKQWLAQMSSSSATVTATESARRTAEPPADEPEVRPARLGLGAQYLPHSRAVKLESDLARRLQRHIAAKPRSQHDADEPKKAAKKTPKKKQDEEQKVAATSVTRRRPALPLDGLLGKKTLPKKQRRQ